MFINIIKKTINFITTIYIFYFLIVSISIWLCQLNFPKGINSWFCYFGYQIYFLFLTVPFILIKFIIIETKPWLIYLTYFIILNYVLYMLRVFHIL
jgi:hypothetical protein